MTTLADSILAKLHPVRVIEPVARELYGVSDVVVDVEASVDRFRAAYVIAAAAFGGTGPSPEMIRQARSHFLAI